MRDPLLALGCHDPAERVREAKQRDARRQTVVDLFTTWWRCHANRPVILRELHHDVRQIADPQDRGRQYLSAYLEKLDGTRIAGFVLTRQEGVGTWGVATYALNKTDDGPQEHRGHRGDRDQWHTFEETDGFRVDREGDACGDVAEEGQRSYAPYAPYALKS